MEKHWNISLHACACWAVLVELCSVVIPFLTTTTDNNTLHSLRENSGPRRFTCHRLATSTVESNQSSTRLETPYLKHTHPSSLDTISIYLHCYIYYALNIVPYIDSHFNSELWIRPLLQQHETFSSKEGREQSSSKWNFYEMNSQRNQVKSCKLSLNERCKPGCCKEAPTLNISASPLGNSNDDMPSYSQEEGEINKLSSCTHHAFLERSLWKKFTTVNSTRNCATNYCRRNSTTYYPWSHKKSRYWSS